MAPELLTNDKEHDQQVDVWAAGVIAFRLLYSSHPNFPFYGTNKEQIIYEIKNCEPDYSKLSCGPQAKKLIRNCLTKDRFKRISVE